MLLAHMAKEMDLPLAVKADSVDGPDVPLTDQTDRNGPEGSCPIDAGSRDVKKSNWMIMIAIRRSALKDRSTGRWAFPRLPFLVRWRPTWIWKPLSLGAMFIAKYGGIVVLSDFTGESDIPAAAGTFEHLHRSRSAP
jgi:acetyl-CoA decarbonylase/synthase complex subunit gamma